MAKITKATVRAFVKKNFNSLYIQNISDFDGMVDMVVKNSNSQFRKAIPTERDYNYTLGIEGIYIIPNRNLFNVFENNEYVGYNVYNCCGEFNIVVRKD